MKAVLERLFRDTLQDIAIEKILPQRLSRSGSRLHIDDEVIDLDEYDQIVVAALGKAAGTMSASLLELLAPGKITGLAVAPVAVSIPGFQTIVGEHPYPGDGSRRGAEALLRTAENLRPQDLLICLLSGGGSALAECPLHSTVSMQDLNALHQLLVKSGASIVEMNVVRKHLSAIKGGRLALAAAPARQVTLYVSDVPADAPDTVASGPTMPDASTAADVTGILQRYNLTDRLPAEIRQVLDTGLQETPKPADSAFSSSSWHCLLDNAAAVNTLRQHAEARGWIVDTDCTVDDWPLSDAVNTLLERLERMSQANPGKTVCLVTGGELSCPVTGDGAGGRNQAFVLRAAQLIADKTIHVMSAGTDGIDGNSTAAGAMADGTTLDRAAAAGMQAADYEQRSDSCSFFTRLGDIIETGPTGNNVRDLRLLVKT